MIRVPFNAQVQPPAPFVPVELTNHLSGAKLMDVPAQLDTAADRTLIPLRLLVALGLEPVDSMAIGGIGGALQRLEVFAVTVAIKSLPGHLLLVVAHDDEPWILLGCDVLNHYRLVLDGPHLVLEIS